MNHKSIYIGLCVFLLQLALGSTLARAESQASNPSDKITESNKASTSEENVSDVNDGPSQAEYQEKINKIKAELRKNRKGNIEGNEPLLQEQKSGSTSDSVLFLSVKMLAGLIFIIFLIVISLRLLKKLQKNNFINKAKNSQLGIDVVDTCYLGKEQKVVIINAHGTKLALGVTTSGISLIKEWPESGQNAIQASETKEKSNHELFAGNLNTFLEKYKKPKTVSQSLEDV